MTITAPVWAPPVATHRLMVDGADTGTPLWVAQNRRERNRGLLGTDGLDGALWIERCSSVHCVGMRYPIDVVHVNGSGRVLAVVRMRPGSIGMPRLRGRSVLEVPAGAASVLGIRKGSIVSPAWSAAETA